MAKAGEIFEVEVYSEICCEFCNEIIHNHMECPICKDKYAGTDLYGEIDELDTEVTCEKCGAEFDLVKYNYTGLTLKYRGKTYD